MVSGRGEGREMSLEISTSQIKDMMDWLIRKNDSIRLGAAGWVAMLTLWWGSMLTIMLVNLFGLGFIQGTLGREVPTMDLALHLFLGCAILLMVGFVGTFCLWCYKGVEEETLTEKPRLIAFIVWWIATGFVLIWTTAVLGGIATVYAMTTDFSISIMLLNLDGFLWVIIFPAYLISYVVLSLFGWREARSDQPCQNIQ
jgi:hypothetical protein